MIKTILNSIRRAYLDSSYQNKLVTSMFLIIMLPVILMTTLSYYRNIQTIKSQSLSISELYLQQAETSINSKLTELANAALNLSRNNNIFDILGKDPQSITVSEQISDLKELELDASHYLDSPIIYNIRIYVKDGFIYSDRNDLTYNLNTIETEKWADMLKEYYSVVYFTDPYEYTYLLNDKKRIISAVVPLRSPKDFDKFNGIICVDMLEEELLPLMQIADYSQKGKVLIAKPNYEPLITYTSPNSTSTSYNLPKEVLQSKDRFYLTISEDHVIGKASLWNSWILISAVSMEDMLSVQSNLSLEFLVLFVIAGIMVYFLSYFYGKQNSKRIKALASQIRVVESGNFNVNCIVDSADEIGDLQASFNYMVRQINNLMKEQYQLGKNLNAMEMRVLQAQINPHFLYNTLDLISWAAKRNDMDAVCDIVLNLSKFYRISLSKGSDYITIANEVEHVRLYVQLQNLRFSKKIELVTEVDKELENYRIMKLLLQPIVENSILHGIANSDKENGVVYLSVKLQNGNIRIVIEDNGIGMDQTTIYRLMTYNEIDIEGQYTGGYGLKNVIGRLKLYYDNKAQISFDSTPGKGTSVTILIPILQEFWQDQAGLI
jgi:two-component system sensor histidine kinase YesM